MIDDGLTHVGRRQQATLFFVSSGLQGGNGGLPKDCKATGRAVHGGGLALAFAMLCFASGPSAAASCSYPAQPSIDWSKCNRQNLMLQGADLTNANLQDTDFGLTDLRNAKLASANLTEAKLVRASLAGAKANKADFSKVEGYRTNFSGVTAEGASFRSAELQRADFGDAVLTGADFEKAELGRAHFDGAQLGDNSFVFANLARAELGTAKIAGQLDFTQAYMFLTRIEGADLSGAKGLVQGQIDIACGDAATKLPAGLTPPAKWPCGAE